MIIKTEIYIIEINNRLIMNMNYKTKIWGNSIFFNYYYEIIVERMRDQ